MPSLEPLGVAATYGRSGFPIVFQKGSKTSKAFEAAENLFQMIFTPQIIWVHDNKS